MNNAGFYGHNQAKKKISKITIVSHSISNREADGYFASITATIDPPLQEDFEIFRVTINTLGDGSASEGQPTGIDLVKGQSQILNLGYIIGPGSGDPSDSAFDVTVKFVARNALNQPITYPDSVDIDFSDYTFTVPAV